VTTLPLDVHLMMTNPDEFIPEFAKAGANILTVHVETCPHLHRTVQSIKEHGMKAGVSLNPATSATTLEHILGDVDLVLVMSVNPGFGGQTFIDSTLDKIRQIRAMISASKGSPYLEVDGGITVKNVASVLKAGANVLVAGSAIFGSDNMSDTIRQLRTADQTVTV
jgi:ribulose-phosphate 3-epimerase